MGWRIVFVHGIGGPRDAGAELVQWTKALADGFIASGHSELAAKLRDGTVDDVEAVSAYYTDLFAPPQAQGSGSLDLTVAESELLHSLLAEMIEARLADEEDGEICRTLKRARKRLEPADQSQGAGEILGVVLASATTLLSIKPLRRSGQWVSDRIMVGNLAQVSRYLGRGRLDSDGLSVDQRIRARVMGALGDRPAVVVAHSLGSVVAMEALHSYAGTVPLLVTIGSPIGLRTVVLPRLLPQPPRTPESVLRWLNFFDRDDIVAARPRFDKDIASNSHGVGPDSVKGRIDSDGLWVHSAVKYLADAAVAGPIAEAVERAAADSAGG
jgi:Alpha/beta hydrolase family